MELKVEGHCQQTLNVVLSSKPNLSASLIPLKLSSPLFQFQVHRIFFWPIHSLLTWGECADDMCLMYFWSVWQWFIMQNQYRGLQWTFTASIVSWDHMYWFYSHMNLWALWKLWFSLTINSGRFGIVLMPLCILVGESQSWDLIIVRARKEWVSGSSRRRVSFISWLVPLKTFPIRQADNRWTHIILDL